MIEARPRTLREQAALRLRVAARRLGGDDLLELSSEPPGYLWLYGSTMIEAGLGAENDVVLKAFLVIGPRRQPGLDHVLAPLASTLPFGRIVIDDEGDVTLLHRIPCERSAARFDAEIDEICRQADRLDDLVHARVGGLRSLDLFQADVMQALEQGAV